MPDNALKFFMHHYIQQFTYKIILLLYSYYFYINKIISYRHQDSSKPFYPLNILILVDPDIETIPLENRRAKLYSIIISDFKSTILKIEETDNIEISIDDIIINYAKIQPKTDNILLAEIYDLIKQLTIFYGNGIKQQSIYTTYADEYITIPQYLGNCWYISMLTCMCYSDASKKIILSKNKSRLFTIAESKANNSDKTFLEIIYFILAITKKYGKYGDYFDFNNEKLCNIFLFFKNNLMKFIYEKYNELNNPLTNGKKKKIRCPK